MTRKPQPRDDRGRFLSRRQVAALKGVQTRLGIRGDVIPLARNRRAAYTERTAALKLTGAFRHGAKARRKTEARLTDEQWAERSRDAARILRASKKKRPTRGGAGLSPPLPTSKTKPTRPTAPSTLRPRHQRTLLAPSGKNADPLRVQIRVRLKIPKGASSRISQAVYDEAIAYRIENGEDHPLAKTSIVRWQNPGRAGNLRRWRQGNQEDAWNTLGQAIASML